MHFTKKRVKLLFLNVETHDSYETSFLTQTSYFNVINNDNLCKF